MPDDSCLRKEPRTLRGLCERILLRNLTYWEKKKISTRTHGWTCRPCRTCFSNADCAGLMRRKRENVRYHNPFRERKVGMSRIRWCVQLSCKDDWKNARVPWFDENIDIEKKNREKNTVRCRDMLAAMRRSMFYYGHRRYRFEHQNPSSIFIIDHTSLFIHS